MKPRILQKKWATTLGLGLFLLAINSHAGVPGVPGAPPIPGVPTGSTNATAIPPGVTTPLPGGGLPTIPPGIPNGIGTIPTPAPPGVGTNMPAPGVGGIPGGPTLPGLGGGIPGAGGGIPGAGGGIPGAGGGIPGAGGGIPGAGGGIPPMVNTNGFPIPGVGTITNAPPVLTPQEIAALQAEAVRIWVRESKVIRRQAREGNPRQQHNLAVLYTLGIGVPLDFKRAHYWFRKAAMQGLPESQFNLGIAYQGGMGVGKNFVTAYQYYSLAATSGMPTAANWRDNIAQFMSRVQIENAHRMTRGFQQGIERWRNERDSDSALEIKLNRILGINPNDPSP